jgi:hypothetical protein
MLQLVVQSAANIQMAVPILRIRRVAAATHMMVYHSVELPVVSFSIPLLVPVSPSMML